MLLRMPHGLVCLAILWAMSPVGSAAQATGGSCALSEAGAAAGWRLEQLAVIPGEHHTAYADFATIASRRADWSYELWDVWTGERLRQLTPPATYATQNSIRESSRDGERAVIDWHVAPATLVDMRTGETLAEIQTFTGEHVPCCAYFTRDNRWLWTSVPDGRWEIRNARSGALVGVIQLARGAQNGEVDLSPDGRRMLVADLALQLVDTASGAVITSVPSRTTLITRLNARFSSDGTRAVIQNGWQWLLLDARSDAQLAAGGRPGEEEFYLDFPEFLDNGAYAQFADNAGGRAIVDVRTGRTHISLGRLAGEPSRAVEFGIQPSPDGRRFIARTPEGAATLWDARTGNQLARLGRFRVESDFEPDEEEIFIHGGRITTSNEFIFTPNGERLVSFDAEGQLSLWNAHSGRRIRVLANNDEIDRYEIDVSADGRWIVAPTDLEEVTVWNARTGAEIVRITGLLGSPISWVLSDEGRYLAIEDDYLRELWDLRARRKIADLGVFGRRIYRATFSRDSAYLLFNRSSDDQTDHILLWSIADGRVLADLGEFEQVNTYINAGREIGAVSWEHASYYADYALWTLAPAQRLLSCSEAHVTLVQQEGREDVRLLEQTREHGVIVWRLTPPG